MVYLQRKQFLSNVREAVEIEVFLPFFSGLSAARFTISKMLGSGFSLTSFESRLKSNGN